MQNSKSQAGTEVQQSGEADVTTSSSHNAKPHVVGSPSLSSQRVLKFRAWDFEAKEMLYANDCFLRLNFNGEVLMRKGDEVTSHFSIMQFIGLIDKYEQEIYEGDILRLDFNNAVFTIEWNNVSACYDWAVYGLNEKQSSSLAYSIEDGFSKSGLPLSQQYEIIGNVFENPELLEGVQ